MDVYGAKHGQLWMKSGMVLGECGVDFEQKWDWFEQVVRGGLLVSWRAQAKNTRTMCNKI